MVANSEQEVDRGEPGDEREKWVVDLSTHRVVRRQHGEAVRRETSTSTPVAQRTPVSR